MRLLALLVLCCLTVSVLYAGELPKPPPLSDQPVAEQKYFKAIYDNFNNAPHYTTGNPNGVRTGMPGDILWATFGGSDRICLNAGTGGLNTTWKCVIVS